MVILNPLESSTSLVTTTGTSTGNTTDNQNVTDAIDFGNGFSAQGVVDFKSTKYKLNSASEIYNVVNGGFMVGIRFQYNNFDNNGVYPIFFYNTWINNTWNSIYINGEV